MKKSNEFRIVAIIILLTFFSVALAHANILVVAPHPDDDTIMASGIVSRAVQRGEQVRIVYVTNGDYLGASAGYTREGEAVSGQNILGLQENDLIFLGYPDGYLQTVYTDYPNSNDYFVTPNNNLS
jgi:LmbE family N-acetylglucosaminyl deacetylase